MKIVISTVAAIFLLGCSQGDDQASKEATATETKRVTEETSSISKNDVIKKNEAIAKEVKELAEKSSTAATEASTTIQEESEKIAKDMTEQAQELKNEIANKSDEIAKDMHDSFEASKEEIQTTAAAAETEVKEATQETQKSASAAVDGATIYKACASCHGANAEKKALNKSQIIKGWEISKTVAALKGYKDGSYGGPMKGIMKPQVSKLSDAEIEAVAKHISQL